MISVSIRETVMQTEIIWKQLPVKTDLAYIDYGSNDIISSLKWIHNGYMLITIYTYID